jgi:hypothetical protein
MVSHMRSHLRSSVQSGRVSFAAGALFICLQTGALAASPVGLWYAEGGAAEVEISECSDGLCGRVVWLRSPIGDDGCELRDDRNPDPASRARPIVGLEILRGSNGLMRRETNGPEGRSTIQLAGELTRASLDWRTRTDSYCEGTSASSFWAGRRRGSGLGPRNAGAVTD